MSVVEILVTCIIAIFGSTGFWSWVQNKSKKKDDVSKLIMGIGYSKIIDLCEKYLSDGSITAREFHELEHYLYEPYHNMGGNGTVQALFDQVKELPIHAS